MSRPRFTPAECDFYVRDTITCHVITETGAASAGIRRFSDRRLCRRMQSVRGVNGFVTLSAGRRYEAMSTTNIELTNK